MDLRQYLDGLWEWAAGIEKTEVQQVAYKRILKNTKKHFYPFVKMQMNRLIMGGLRYGLIQDKNKGSYDRTRAIAQRLMDYDKNGNLELLVDISNLAFLEYVESSHPKKHFCALDDGDHVKRMC